MEDRPYAHPRLPNHIVASLLFSFHDDDGDDDGDDDDVGFLSLSFSFSLSRKKRESFGREICEIEGFLCFLPISFRRFPLFRFSIRFSLSNLPEVVKKERSSFIKRTHTVFRRKGAPERTTENINYTLKTD